MEASPVASDFLLWWWWLSQWQFVMNFPWRWSSVPLVLFTCPSKGLWQVLPATFAALLALECTWDAKNKFQGKLSSCLENEFSALFVLISNWLMLAMLWGAGSNTDAMPRLSRWAGGKDTIHATEHQRSQESMLHDLVPPCTFEKNCVISQDFSVFICKMQKVIKELLSSWKGADAFWFRV